MNTELITNLLNEHVKKSERLKEIEKILDDYRENIKIIFSREILEVKNYSNIFKSFYFEEHENNKIIIQELSSTIDDILLK